VIYSLYNYLHDQAGDATENIVNEIMVEIFSEYILSVSDTKQTYILLSAAFLDLLVHDMLSSTTSQYTSSKSNAILKKILTRCEVNSTADTVDQCCTQTIQREIARMASLPKDSQDFCTVLYCFTLARILDFIQARFYYYCIDIALLTTFN
jgi:hypothetical protein